MRDRGPYTNEQGDWWFPVDAWGWNEAQKEAAMFARESDCVSRYMGLKVDVPLYEEDPEDGTMRKRTAYHFREVDPFDAALAAALDQPQETQE